MFTELLTPIIIAMNPITIDTSVSSEYDHQKQVLALLETTEVQEEIARNSTQTFDWKGRPSDSDWD